MIPETDYRFDRVQKNDVWPALIWEAGRDAHDHNLPGESITWHHLKTCPGFPEKSWLELSEDARVALAERFSPPIIKAKDGAELLHFHTSNFASPNTPEAWREQLARMGCVVLNIGVKGRHTKAELVALFEAWLDASPDWCAAQKRIPSYGRSSPEDGLRAIAWNRIFRQFKHTRPASMTVDSAAMDAVMRSTDFKRWLQLPTTQPKRSKLSAEACAWRKRIVVG